MTKRRISIVCFVSLAVVVAIGGAVGGVWASSDEGSDSNAGGANAASASPLGTIYAGEARLVRSGETQWQIELGEVGHPIVISALGGRTDIPLDAELEGRINLGLHRSRMVILIETDEPALYQAVLWFDGTEADRLSDSLPNNVMKIPPGESPAAIMARAELMVVGERLRFAYYLSSGLTSFGSPPGDFDTERGLESRCPGGSCGCFLGCHVCCPAGSLPDCDCRILVSAGCKCVQAKN